MSNLGKIEVLTNYFEKLGPQFDLAFATDKGTYLPASIIHIASILDKLIQKNIINKNQYFLDAGSGDGRIVALASSMGFRASGIEYNDVIYESSVENIEKLIEKKILETNPILIKGDFLDNVLYAKKEINFKDFKIVFNFNTLPYQLVEKICSESTKDTIFIFNSIQQVLENNNCLELIDKEHFQDIHQLLHIYKKI